MSPGVWEPYNRSGRQGMFARLNDLIKRGAGGSKEALALLHELTRPEPPPEPLELTPSKPLADGHLLLDHNSKGPGLDSKADDRLPTWEELAFFRQVELIDKDDMEEFPDDWFEANSYPPSQ